MNGLEALCYWTNQMMLEIDWECFRTPKPAPKPSVLIQRDLRRLCFAEAGTRSVSVKTLRVMLRAEDERNYGVYITLALKYNRHCKDHLVHWKY